MKGDTTVEEKSPKPKRLPPVRIPLDFETAVTAFSQVDPRGPIAKKPAKKKPRRKK
jgi:hypothetical protein